jgi:DNA-binding response OmpR family regulator
MARVLVVEDDQMNQQYLTTLLRGDGYDVIAVNDGSDVLEQVDRQRPDLILLDVVLPGIGGIELCRRLRERTQTPIIFISGRRDEVDKVLALDAGGDDYVVKPFGHSELAARIRVMLRRRPNPGDQSGQLAAGGVVLDNISRQAWVRGRQIVLTPREFDLLRALLRHPDQVVTRQELFDQVWGVAFYGDGSTLYVYIHQLRQKIETEVDRPRLIQTVRGVGFRFVVGTADHSSG